MDIRNREAIRAELDWLKTQFSLLTAGAFALVGWIAAHYQQASPPEMTTAVMGLLLDVIALIRINHRAWQNIRALDDFDETEER